MKKAMPIVSVLVLIACMIGILMIQPRQGKNNNPAQEVKALVLETENSHVEQAGITKIGDQSLTVRILEGKHKGKEIHADNYLNGKLEVENFYKKGDKILITILEEGNQIIDAKALDLDRGTWQLILFAVFVICLIAYAGFVGLKALFSFVATLCILWKFLIPGLLNGYNPMLFISFVLMLIIGVILFSIAGFTQKGVVSFFGTLIGLLITAGITIFFGEKLALGGMTEPFAEALIYSGYFTLNLEHIFYGAILIGASGAAMDVAMDVAASMEEIKIQKPEITRKELIQSGMNIGKAVIGTMATTLLLAYSGGYLTLLMVFVTKNASFERMINLKIVSAEIMRTVVGSIGIILVAPITAILAGWIYCADFKPYFQKIKQALIKDTSLPK